MAAKVGLTLALDGEKEFSAGLKAASAAVKEAKSGFDAVKELYADQANTSTALAARQKELVKIQQTLNEKMEAAEKGMDNSNLRLNQINEKLSHYKDTASELKDALAELESQGKKNTREYELTEQALRDVEEAEKAEQLEKNKQLASFAKWQTAINQTNKEITKNNREIEKNATYLEEASKYADGCAVSMDKFGNEIRDIGKAKADASVNVLKKEFDEYKESLSENTEKAKSLSDSLTILNMGYTELSNVVKRTNIDFEGEENTIEALTAKNKALLDVNAKLHEKQENLSEAMKNSEDYLSKIETQLGTYTSKINETTEAMERCDRSTKEGREEYQRLEAELKELKSEQEEVANEETKQIAVHAKLYTELSKTNLELTQNNKELSKNAGYLKEAEKSADGCATSIDRFGKEVKKTKESTNVLEETLGENIAKSRELSEQMSQLNAKQTEATSTAKAVDIAFEGQANTMNALVAKHEALMGIDLVLVDKQTALTNAVNNSEDAISKIDSQMASYKSKIAATTEAMANCDRKTKEGREEYERLEAELKDLVSGEAELTSEHTKYVASNAKLRSELAKVNTELEQNNSELEKNEKYLSEAESDANGCATSIDRFGKEVRESKEEAKSFGDILEDKLFKQFTKEKLIDIAINAIRRLGQACINAGKEVLKLGMEYNAQMSKVQAVSQANAREMQLLDQTARDLGKNTVFTAKEAGEGMQSLAMAGLKTSDIIKSIPAVLNLSAAAGMDLGVAASYVADNLNAFGENADYASRMSDIMAYAMANSDQTAEDLGEAYKKVAASAHGFGFSEEEVTAVLMVMANNGKRAGESGAALNTIMTRLAVNTKDCADEIANIVGHEVVYDEQTREMRSLTEILDDIGGAWDGLTEEQQNNLTYVMAGTRQSTALRTIMSGLKDEVEGTGKSFHQYKEELEGCYGAAEDMANVSLNNLQGDVTLLNSALSGLGIELEGKLDGSLRTIVQGLTDIINGLTDAIANPKAAIEQFIDDVDKSNESVANSIDRIHDITNNAGTTQAELETYGEILLQLNERTDLSATEQYALKTAIDALSVSIPELSAAFDEQTWSLNLSDEKIKEMISDAERLTVVNALLDAQTEIMNAQIQAKIATNKATVAQTQAEIEYAESVSDASKAQQGLISWEDYRAKHGNTDYVTALKNANEAVDEATEHERELQKEEFITRKALAETAAEYGLVVDAAGNYSAVMEEAAEASANASDEIEHVFDMYGNDITFLEPEDAEAVTEATKEIIDAFTEMRESVVADIEACIDMMEKFDGGDEISADDIISNLESQKKGLETWSNDMIEISKNVGNGMSEEMYNWLLELGPESANLIHTIAEESRKQGTEETSQFSDIVQEWDEAMAERDNADVLAAATEQGQAIIEAEREGITTGYADLETDLAAMQEAVTNASGDATDAAETGGEETGSAFGEKTEASINNASSATATAGANLVKQAKASAYAETAGASSIGINIASGVAAGVYSGSGAVAEACASMVRGALQAAKNAIFIKSPSRKFRDEVGKQISNGTALGIKENTKTVISASANMSKSALKSATSWLTQYKKSHKVSLEDEKYYWKEVQKHLKKGSDAYESVAKKISAINKKLSSKGSGNILTEAGFTAKQASVIAKKINNAFNVSWYTGSGKNQKKKDAEKYYKDVLSAANNYATDQKKINDWSLEQESAYWNKLLKTIKKGTSAYQDVRANIAQVDKKIAEQTLRNKNTLLDYYKTYNTVGLKGEMQYWNTVRQLFKKGTAERIEADQKYLDAKADYYDALKDADEEYEKSLEEIEETRQSKIKELNDAYHDAVESRKNDILSQMDLFEAFDTEGYTSDKLIQNLASQVEALSLWEEKLQELKDRGISDELYEMLTGAGLDGAANVYSIAQMTDEQLRQYEELFKQRSELAHSQAVKENHQLLVDTNNGIQEAIDIANDALDELNKSHKEKIAEIRQGISNELKMLIKESGALGEDALAEFFKGMTVDTKATYKVQKITQKLTSELANIVEESAVIGQDSLKGILQGLADENLIKSGANNTINLIQKALQEAADIHSPSRRFKDSIGRNLGLGIVEGIEETEDVLNHSTNSLIDNMIASAQKEFSRRQEEISGIANGLNSGGIHMLNELMGNYSPNTIVNVDNSSIAMQMAAMVGQMSEVMQSIMNMQVVMDSGELVGAIAPGINSELGNISARDNRGRIRGR